LIIKPHPVGDFRCERLFAHPAKRQRILEPQ
jgi:hypothetical protein